MVQRGFEYWRETSYDIYSVDYYLPLQKVGIEIDGPQHFICPNEKPSQTTLAKRRYLRNIFGPEKFYYVTGNFIWKEETCIDAVLDKIDHCKYTHREKYAYQNVKFQ